MRWYESFFDGVAMDFWRAGVPPEWTQSEVGFLWDVLGLKAGSSVLDVPCGFGRHALALAARGVRVKGFDIAAACVREVNEIARRDNLPAEAERADMARAEFGGPYDGACCLGNSFGYLDHKDMGLFCRRVAAALRPGGTFVVNTAMAAESLIPDYTEREWMTAGGITALLENEYHAARSVLVTQYTFLRGGRTEKRASEHRVYTAAELQRLLTDNGFAIRDLFGAPFGRAEKTAYKYGDSQLYIVARRT
jgi:2-polyprenyl-3-methyl-5-hydroxy-6-metoxy-1,4-benzoquinol methylase